MAEKKDRDSLHQIQEPATAQAAQRWCVTMDRPAASCGCPDCGSSLIDLPAKAAPPAASVVLPEPVAYSLGLAKYAHSSNIIAANEFTPDAEHADEWENLYTEQQVRALLATATGLPAQASWLQPKDLESLQRFEETASDNQGHDIGKAAATRLAGFGCLQSHGFGVYSITDFGHFVLDDWEHARALPFRTQEERDADHRAAIAAAKEE